MILSNKTMTVICNIYRSDSKQGLYLYLQKGKTMDNIPGELLIKIGLYTEVMETNLSKRYKLAQVDIEIVKKN